MSTSDQLVSQVLVPELATASTGQDPDQLSSAQKRIEELEKKHLRQELEIRRLQAALSKASFMSTLPPHGILGSDAPSCSTKSVEEMTSCSPSSQLSPRTVSSASVAEIGLAAVAAAAEALAAIAQPHEEPVKQADQDGASEVQSVPASIPSTPEMPVHEFRTADMPSAVVSFFNQWQSFHSGATSPHTADSSSCRPSTPPYTAPESTSPVGSLQMTPEVPPTAFSALLSPVASSTLGDAPGPQVNAEVSPPRPVAEHVWYRVAFRGGICVRAGPDADAPRTGLTMPENEVFAVSEFVHGPDQRVYLRIADGRGWVFDDSALFPEDPAVVRGHWAPAAVEQAVHQVPSQEMPSPAVMAAQEMPPSGVLAHGSAGSWVSQGGNTPSDYLLQMPPAHPSALQPACDHLEVTAAPGCPTVVTCPHDAQSCQPLYSSGSGAAGSGSPAPGAVVHTPPPYLPEQSIASQEILSQPQPQLQLQSPVSWYRVAFCGGISVRMGPDVNAPRTGNTLLCHEVFAVAESVLGVDRRVYLRLLDGRGWVFDDTMLVPEDPAVIRIELIMPPSQCPPGHCAPTHSPLGPPPGSWQPMAHNASAPGVAVGTLLPGAEHQHWNGMPAPQGTLRRWTRGKRGGVKKHRRRNQTAE